MRVRAGIFYCVMVLLLGNFVSNAQVIPIQQLYKFIPQDSEKTFSFRPSIEDYHFRQFIAPAKRKELIRTESINYTINQRLKFPLKDSGTIKHEKERRIEHTYYKNGKLASKLLTAPPEKKEIHNYTYVISDSFLIVKESVSVGNETTAINYFFSLHDSLLIRQEIIRSTGLEQQEYSYVEYQKVKRIKCILRSVKSNDGMARYKREYEYSTNRDGTMFREYFYSADPANNETLWIPTDTVQGSDRIVKDKTIVHIITDRKSSRYARSNEQVVYLFDNGILKSTSIENGGLVTMMDFLTVNEAKVRRVFMTSEYKDTKLKENSGIFTLTPNNADSYNVTLDKSFSFTTALGLQYNILEYTLITKAF